MNTTQHKIAAIGMLITIGLAFLLGMAGVDDDGIYAIIGVALMGFGIWSSVLLLRLK